MAEPGLPGWEVVIKVRQGLAVSNGLEGKVPVGTYASDRSKSSSSSSSRWYVTRATRFWGHD